VINWTVRGALAALVVALLLSAMVGAAAPGDAPDRRKSWSAPRDGGLARAAPGGSASSARTLSEEMGVPVCQPVPPCVPAGYDVKPVTEIPEPADSYLVGPVAEMPEPAPSRPSLSGERVTATVDGLRFRAGPGLDEPILGLLYSGDRLYVREEYHELDAHADWIGVLVQGRSASGLPHEARGYVHRSYVTSLTGRQP
jgi:hypothetical protein